MSGNIPRHAARGSNKLRGPEHFAGGCRNKVGYTSRRAAMGVRRVVLANSATPGNAATFNAYKCTRCGRWHLGNRIASLSPRRW